MGMEPPQRGGSFLGTAAATAAGMIGGGLLLNGIRGMLGGAQQRPGGPFAGAFDQIASGGSHPPGGGSEGGGSLGREAGLDDIGRGGREHAGLFGSSDDHADDDHGGSYDTADYNADGDDADFDDGDDGSDDTGYA